MLGTEGVHRVVRTVPRPLYRLCLRVVNRWTGYRRLHAVVPQTPTSFTQKLYHRMAYDRRPLLTTFADKVAAREYVAERLGEDYLSKRYGVYDRGRDIRWDDIPREFVLKPAHGSGSVVVVWEGVPRGATLDGKAHWGYKRLIHPDDLDRESLARVAQDWIKLGFAHHRLHSWPEWCYSDIPRRVVVEELLLDQEGGLPADYKFFMFDGVCRMIEVDTSRFTGHRRDLFTPQWEYLPVQYHYPPADIEPSRPPNLQKMLAAAEALSQGMDFVRVDLYDLGDRVVFGELTNYPLAGLMGFDPPEYDELLGSYWTLPASTKMALGGE